MVDHREPPQGGFEPYTWQVHVTLFRELRRMESGLTHAEAAKMMKLCRALFPKSVIICSIDREQKS